VHTANIKESSRAARTRSLVAIIASTVGVGLTYGINVPLVALILESRGETSFTVGMVTAMGTLAVMVCGPIYPRLIARLGPMRSCVCGILIAMVALLLLPALPSLPAWYVLKFIIGFGMGWSWITSETWINAVSSEESRGTAVGLYTTLLTVGFVSGPLILRFTGAEGWLPFLVGAAALVAALAPLPFARGAQPQRPEAPPAGLVGLMRNAPVLMLAGLVAGIGDTTAFAMLPLYGMRSGFEESTAVTMLAVFIAGNLFLQLPIGWLADRIDRKGMLILCAVVGMAGPAVLHLTVPHPYAMWALLFFWGGTMFGFYTIGLTMLGEQFDAKHLAGANSAFVMLYCAGGVAGPIAAGVGMDLWDPHGLMLAMGIASALLLVPMVLQRYVGRLR